MSIYKYNFLTCSHYLILSQSHFIDRQIIIITYGGIHVKWIQRLVYSILELVSIEWFCKYVYIKRTFINIYMYIRYSFFFILNHNNRDIYTYKGHSFR